MTQNHLVWDSPSSPAQAAFAVRLSAPAPLGDLAARFGAAVATWRARRARRRTEQTLRGLSGAVLKDLGLHRSEAGSVAYGAAHERRRAHAAR